MKRRNILLGITAAAIVLGAIICWAQFKVFFSPGTLAAVSVIGGADGPTSIFIAGKVGTSSIFHDFLVVLAVGAVLLSGVIIWEKRRK